MRVRETVRILGGSIFVYVVVATCGKAGTHTAVRDGGTVDVSARGGPDVLAPGGPDVSASGGVDVSRVLDVLTNPVPDARADSTQSGSRLKAIYYLGADGSKYTLPNQWYDSQRSENCSFRTAADGNLRCLPYSGAAVGNYFADAGCTQQLVSSLAGSGCAVPNTATTSPTNTAVSCQLSGYVVYQVGSLFTGAAYSGTPSSCSKAVVPSYYALYSLGAQIPASSFVAATLQTDQ